MVRSWWVNQSEHRGGLRNDVVWAPKRAEENRPPHFSWLNLLEINIGDLIFHYTGPYLVGVSQAVGTAEDHENPYGNGSEWQTEGWRIPVRYEELSRPIHLSDIPEAIRQDNHSSLGGPFNVKLHPIQAYLLPVKANLAQVLLEIIGFSPNESHDAANSEMDSVAIEGPTDQIIQSVGRAEQQKMRSLLLRGKHTSPCGICGKETPAQYLVAAHIKPRSLCSEDERRDPNVLMLACVFGCDAAFEDGGLRVLEEGRVSVEPGLLNSRPELFKELNGSTAPAFHSKTEPYFKQRTEILEP